MFRTTLLTTTTLLLFATGALAEGGNAAPPPPPVVVEPETCPDAFDCAYIGLEAGLARADGTVNGDVLGLSDDETAIGVFGGYNVQNGNLVFGGEARYLSFEMPGGITGSALNDVFDLRGRVGVASGSFLGYAALGYSWSAYDPGGGGSVDVDGMNFGVGAEYNVSEDFFVGADYTGRSLEGGAYEIDLNTLTLRAGFRF
jgi:opacity protein-like surface antigen